MPGGAVNTWSALGYNSSLGAYNVYVPFSATGQEANIQMTTNCFSAGHIPMDLTGRSIQARIWMDAAVAGDGARHRAASSYRREGAGPGNPADTST